ncbi:hypothetical protein EON81_18980 [bacterium]|nr:MAG: hypothetical protein EON81_18980 [bacterium]
MIFLMLYTHAAALFMGYHVTATTNSGAAVGLRALCCAFVFSLLWPVVVYGEVADHLAEHKAKEESE